MLGQHRETLSQNNTVGMKAGLGVGSQADIVNMEREWPAEGDRFDSPWGNRISDTLPALWWWWLSLRQDIPENGRGIISSFGDLWHLGT